MGQTVTNVLLIAAAVVLLLWPLSRAWADPVAKMHPTELAQRLEARDPVLLLDVRTPAELQDGAIAGVVNIPLDQIPDRIGEIKARLEARPETGVILVCRSDARARRVAPFLVASGVGKVAVLAGGMVAWAKAGLPMVAPGR